MKTVFLFLGGIFLLINNSYILADDATILVSGGVHLREAPSPNAKSLSIVPQGAKVTVRSKTDSVVTIDKLTDNWCSVQTDHQSGWVFCAYIGFFYTANSCKDGIKSYLPPETQISKKQESEKIANPPHFAIGDFRKKITRYKNGLVFTETLLYEGTRETYYLPGSNLYEAYMMAKQCYLTEKSWQELSLNGKEIILSNDPNAHYIIRKTKDGVEIQTEFWT